MLEFNRCVINDTWYNLDKKQDCKMKIIIIGAGFTGTRLAKRLISERNDVVLIDNDEETVRHASNRLDCMVMHASGNSLQTLEAAGIARTDAIVAVTNSDELNMITCSLVESVYPHVTKIARVRNYEYYYNSAQTNRRTYGIDFMVHPDLEAASEIVTAVEHGAITDVVEFDDSDYELTSVRLEEGCVFAGMTVLDVRKTTETPLLFAFVEKKGRSFFPSGAAVLEAGDRIGVLVHKDELSKILDLCGTETNVIKKIALVGAGKIGTNVAEQLLKGKIKDTKSLLKKQSSKSNEFIIVDSDKEKAKAASENFPMANVFHADITDEGFLEEENLSSFDLVITATRNHELNMIASAYMKTLGVSKTVCLVQSGGYAAIARDIGIDVAVPIKDAVIDSILSHLRGKGVTGVHTVTDGRLEIIEIVVPHDSSIIGEKLSAFSKLEAFIVLLVKKIGEDNYQIPSGDDVYEEGDRIIFLVHIESTFETLELFGVGK